MKLNYVIVILCIGCVCVCPSVSICHKSAMVGHIGGLELMGIGLEASFDQPTLRYKEIAGTSKNKGTSLWNFATNSKLRKFRHGIGPICRLQRVVN